jgi:peptide/nickel transport system substrate-binding protein
VTRALAVAIVVVTLCVPLGEARDPTPRRGGVLTSLVIEDPPGFLIHEAATTSILWPMMSCYSNLVLFDQQQARETVETIVPELAERWSWQDNYRNLVFFLRKNVTWHDGKPFTSRDVKYTFDVVREAKDAPARLRLSPRKEWYDNVESIETPDAHSVIFKLRRPQPSLLLMLAAGYSPVLPAHVPIAELRQRCMGTGPFRLKQYVRGQVIEMERNPGYFVPDRPYLDGLRFLIITERSTRLAALQTNQVDAFIPLEMTKAMADTVRATTPAIVVSETGQLGSDNVVLNHKRAPFDNVTVRRAISHALDRNASVKAVRHGGAVVGAALMPPPFGTWGLPEKELQPLAGYHGATDKTEARRLLAQAGYGPGKPLRVELTTRTSPVYLDLAAFVVDQLHRVGIEVTTRELDTPQYFPALARHDFQIGANLTAPGVDDPDAALFENYKCGTARNYSNYCSEETDAMIERQSAELSVARRRTLVWDIQRRLEADVARPILGWRIEYFAQWPYVRNLVAHHSLYNWSRLQNVWLDR